EDDAAAGGRDAAVLHQAVRRGDRRLRPRGGAGEGGSRDARRAREVGGRSRPVARLIAAVAVVRPAARSGDSTITASSEPAALPSCGLSRGMNDQTLYHSAKRQSG